MRVFYALTPFLRKYLLGVIDIRAGVGSVIFVEGVRKDQSKTIICLQRIDICVNIDEHVHSIGDGGSSEASDCSLGERPDSYPYRRPFHRDSHSSPRRFPRTGSDRWTLGDSVVLFSCSPADSRLIYIRERQGSEACWSSGMILA